MFVHYTHPDNVESVLQRGLEIGRDPVLSTEGLWALDFYETNPVYLTRPDSRFAEAFLSGEWRDHACFEVDTRGLPMVADLVSMIDAGARLHEGWLDFRRAEALRPLLRFADEYGFVEIEFLLDPSSDAARAAIEATGTAACLETVPPSRLSLRPAMPQSAP